MTAVCSCGETASGNSFVEWFLLGLHILRGHEIEYSEETRLDSFTDEEGETAVEDVPGWSP